MTRALYLLRAAHQQFFRKTFLAPSGSCWANGNDLALPTLFTKPDCRILLFTLLITPSSPKLDVPVKFQITPPL